MLGELLLWLVGDLEGLQVGRGVLLDHNWLLLRLIGLGLLVNEEIFVTLFVALELELVSDLGDVHTPLPVIVVQLVLDFSVFVLPEYVISKFDSTSRVFRVLVVGPPADPRGLGHGGIYLLQSELSLNVLFVDIRDHIRWLDERH